MRSSILLATVLAATGLPLLQGRPADATTTTYSYTGGPASYVVPAGVTAVDVVADGAQGGGWVGGRGSRLRARLVVVPGETLWITVGGGGSTPFGGFNGGGDGGGMCCVDSGGGGGGATDIRRGSDTVAGRILVAAGGGGSSADSAYGGTGDGPGQGSPNGWANGDAGPGPYSASQRTNRGPGTGTGGFGTRDPCLVSTPGSPGLGGAGGGRAPCGGYFAGGGGGGGGGYWGGGGGEASYELGQSGGGGGGSSYVEPSAAITVSVSTGGGCCYHGSLTITAIPAPLPPIPPTQPPPIRPTQPPPGPAWPSSACDTGMQVHDGTIGGTYLEPYPRQPTGQSVHVCFRIGNRGGRIEITPTAPDVRVDGAALPSRDTNWSACATAGGTPYFADAHVNGATA